MAIDKSRLIFFGVAAAAGEVGFLYGQPLIHKNELAINVIVTVFSILAGFLVAIMTIMGESGFSSRSWRANELNRTNIYRRLVRQKYMFYLYLVTLGLIFLSSLLSKNYQDACNIIERLYLGLAIFTFVLSLGLPGALMKIQMSRQDEIIKSKRRSAGINE